MSNDPNDPVDPNAPEEAGEGAPAAAAEDLSDELARKYDPDRLLSMVARRAGRGEALEASVRARYERRFGVDLSHVRVYTGEFAEEFNRQRNAYAVTVGSTGMILMGGSPDRALGTARGAALLGHELAHVAQAQRGLFRKGAAGDTPLAHEDHEADAEAHEAEILAEEHGQHKHEDGRRKLARDKARKDDVAKIKARVMELFAEAERLHELRTGAPRRP